MGYDLFWYVLYLGVILCFVAAGISPFDFAKRNDGRLVAGLSMLAVTLVGLSFAVLVWTGRL